MKLLLLGANGQVGWELTRSLALLGELTACGRGAADLEQPEALTPLIEAAAPDVIVNAAAYTAVDQAEAEPERAARINTDAVEALARQAARRGCWLVHYSTDYVFNGRKFGRYDETDAPDPLSVYGRTKLAGEEAIRRSGCRHLIFRTSWIYAARGHNFIRTILHLARKRDELKIVADQVGAPTAAELIADVTALALFALQTQPERAADLSGTYHLTARGEVSWHAYARFIVAEWVGQGRELRSGVDQILPIPTTEYPRPAPRPLNSRLDVDRLERTFQVRMPPWEHHARRTIGEMLSREAETRTSGVTS